MTAPSLPGLLSTVLAVAGVALLPAPAAANGNVSHQWVTHAAIEATPVGGSLHALVSDPALVPMLDTGTMYPDWGYTPGATAEEREAGEASHWEPVQDAYRQWIVASYSPPWSDEARRHLAFWLGMSSHGIADQSYDAMFFERSRFYEPGDHDEFDQDTDVLWAASAGPGQPPRAWVPVEPLLTLFQSIVGVAIEQASMEQQLGFVGIAIAAVNAIASDPTQVADAGADFPWAAMHDDDPAMPGNPPHEAEIVRRYWRSNWALVHGDAIPRPVLWTHPADGSAGHPTEAASIESWVSVVFARALVGPELDPERFHLEDSTGGGFRSSWTCSTAMGRTWCTSSQPWIWRSTRCTWSRSTRDCRRSMETRSKSGASRSPRGLEHRRRTTTMGSGTSRIRTVTSRRARAPEAWTRPERRPRRPERARAKRGRTRRAAPRAARARARPGAARVQGSWTVAARARAARARIARITAGPGRSSASGSQCSAGGDARVPAPRSAPPLSSAGEVAVASSRPSARVHRSSATSCCPLFTATRHSPVLAMSCSGWVRPTVAAKISRARANASAASLHRPPLPSADPRLIHVIPTSRWPSPSSPLLIASARSRCSRARA